MGSSEECCLKYTPLAASRCMLFCRRCLRVLAQRCLSARRPARHGIKARTALPSRSIRNSILRCFPKVVELRIGLYNISFLIKPLKAVLQFAHVARGRKLEEQKVERSNGF